MADPVPQEFAARMGDPIQHTKTFAWGWVGAAIGAAIVVGIILFPPSALLEIGGALVAGDVAVAGTAAATSAAGGTAMWTSIGAVSTGISAGKAIGEDAGSHFNYIAGDIADGSPTVAIGHGQPKAARMSDPLRCHPGQKIATGSINVFMDKPLWNASRKMLDYTECGGQIEDGCHTVLIGGQAIARPGSHIKESPSMFYKVVFITNDVVGAVASVGTGLAWKTLLEKASTVGKITGIAAKGYKDAADLGAPLPYAKEVDVFGGLVSKGPGAWRDAGRFAAGDVARNTKLLGDIAGTGVAKPGGYLTNPSTAPHIPAYGAGGP